MGLPDGEMNDVLQILLVLPSFSGIRLVCSTLWLWHVSLYMAIHGRHSDIPMRILLAGPKKKLPEITLPGPEWYLLYFALPRNVIASLLSCQKRNGVQSGTLPYTERTFRLYFLEFTSEIIDLTFILGITCFSFSLTINTCGCWCKSQSTNY